MTTKKETCESAESIIRNLYHLYCKESGEKIDKIHISNMHLRYRVQKYSDGKECFIPRNLIDFYHRHDDDNARKMIDCFKTFKVPT